MTALSEPYARFRTAYAEHRAAEGRGMESADLLSLPYLEHGAQARAWKVRAATFDALLRWVVRRRTGPLRVLDLGAGNGWLSYRLAREGHICTAVDIRDDAIDGLGAAGEYLSLAAFTPLVASFDALPMGAGSADLTVFNASLHYATDLHTVLAEAVRVTQSGGRIAILDSPFYTREAAGAAMIAEKHAAAPEIFGARASVLMSLPFIEFLTRERLAQASAGLGLRWRRRRVRYPLWYEVRGLVALLRRRRRPSRFDLWTADVP